MSSRARRLQDRYADVLGVETSGVDPCHRLSNSISISGETGVEGAGVERGDQLMDS
jgi:hypothetical protein